MVGNEVGCMTSLQHSCEDCFCLKGKGWWITVGGMASLCGGMQTSLTSLCRQIAASSLDNGRPWNMHAEAHDRMMQSAPAHALQCCQKLVEPGSALVAVRVH